MRGDGGTVCHHVIRGWGVGKGVESRWVTALRSEGVLVVLVKTEEVLVMAEVA
jgi:hypothetical protein